MAERRMRGARHARRGAAMVELALILPIFLTLTVGAIEFGRAFMVQQVLTYAAREGARYGVLPAVSNGQVQARVAQALEMGGIDPSLAEITVSPENLDTATTGTQVHVGIRVHYLDVTWLPAPWFLGQARLSSETIMRHE